VKTSTTGPWLRPSLALALAYFVTGTLGLLLAVPPGYATAVWPPSGIALATILLVGPRGLPGVALGSFAVNVLVGADLGDLDALARAAPIGASIAAGAALQAGVGAALVRRFVGAPLALDTGRDVARFLVLGGPVACLVNATWGTTSLLLAGAIDGDAYAFGWWTWWVGDVIGVITIAPLVLVAFGEPREIWSPRRTSLAVPLAVTFALAVALFARVNQLERVRLHTADQQQARATAAELARRIDALLAPLHATLHVPLAARGAYVDSASAPPAAALTWTPIAGARPGPAIGEPLATDGGPRGLRVTLPLDGGVAVATIDVAAVAAGLTPPLVADGFAVELADHTPATPVPFAIDAAPGQRPAPDVAPVEEPLMVAGRRWVLRLVPTTAYPRQHRTWAAWTVLASGLIFTGVLGALLLVITGRTSRIESLVADRTRELAERAAVLAEREAQLRSSLHDKDVLLKEIHHRVKNNLQVISSLLTLQALAVADESVKDQLEVTRERIRSMTMIHEQLYQSRDLGRVDLGEYARALLGHLVTALALASRGIEVESDIEEVPVSIDAAVPAGLLLAELITNACKHAFPAGRTGTIRVEVARRTEGKALLVVADDGVGIPAGLTPAGAQTLGLELVTTFAAQLGAELVMEPQTPGTRVRVSFAAG
jgi:two-component sensor histidine kinase/integral membrane sensor domain MASE1